MSEDSSVVGCYDLLIGKYEYLMQKSCQSVYNIVAVPKFLDRPLFFN
jgi:hypothetical protein